MMRILQNASYKKIFFILLLILILCVICNLFRFRRVSIGADEFGYISYARNIAQHHSFFIHYPPVEQLLKKANIQNIVHDPGITAAIYQNGKIISKYPIGFPLFLAFIIKLFGLNAVFYISPIFLILFILIFTFTIAIALPSPIRWPGAIIAAASLLGGYRYLFQYSLTPLKEITALTFMYISILFIVQFLKKSSITKKWHLFIMGFFMGYACLTRSSLIIIAQLCMVAIMIRQCQFNLRHTLYNSFIIIVSFLIPFSLQILKGDWSFVVMIEEKWMLPKWSLIPIITGFFFSVWIVAHVFKIFSKRKELNGKWIRISILVFLELTFFCILICYILGIFQPILTKGTRGTLFFRIVKNGHLLSFHYGIFTLLLIAFGSWWTVQKNLWSIFLLVLSGSIYFIFVSYFNDYCSPRYLLPVHILWISAVPCGIFALQSITANIKSLLTKCILIGCIIFLGIFEWFLTKSSFLIWPKITLLSLVVFSTGWCFISEKSNMLKRIVELLGICILVLGACIVISKPKKTKVLFRQKNIQELKSEFIKVLPSQNTVILAYRYLCQNLDIHTPYFSFSPNGLAKAGIPPSEMCSQLIDNGYTVAIIDNRGVKHDGKKIVKRLSKDFTLIPLYEIDAKKYNASSRHLFGRSECTLYQITRKAQAGEE